MAEFTFLDLRDRKLLFELDLAPRLSLSHIGKKVGISKQGVEYKLKKLQESKVVLSFYPVVNLPKLGYLYCRLLITLHNVSVFRQKQLINYVTSHSKVPWVIKTHGIYDLGVAFWAKNVTEFKKFIEELTSKFGDCIKHKSESIATNVIHLQCGFLLQTPPNREVELKETSNQIKIDETDAVILRVLCKNARVSIVEIARQTKLSPSVVNYRIKKMEKENLIAGYRPLLDHVKIGYSYYKLFINLNRISHYSLTSIKNYLKQEPRVFYLVDGIGIPAELDVEIMVKSNNELIQFIDALRSKFPSIIADYQTLLITSNLKLEYLPF